MVKLNDNLKKVKESWYGKGKMYRQIRERKLGQAGQESKLEKKP